jgi:hypothetical protein
MGEPRLDGPIVLVWAHLTANRSKASKAASPAPG